MMDAHVSDLLSAYLDEDLAAEERARVDRHLPTCTECSAMLGGLRATLAEMRALPEPEPRGADSIALRAAIARARSGRSRVWAGLTALGGATAAVVAFVAFAGGPAGQVALDLGSGMAESAGIAQQDSNYDQEAARALLNGDVQVTSSDAIAPSQPHAASPNEEKAFTSGRGKAENAGVDWDATRASCEPTILEGATDPYDLRTIFAARYEGAPALFLLYAVGDPVDRRELWVMSPSCDVLLFAEADP